MRYHRQRALSVPRAAPFIGSTGARSNASDQLNKALLSAFEQSSRRCCCRIGFTVRSGVFGANRAGLLAAQPGLLAGMVGDTAAIIPVPDRS
jgi:hypothetical protein